MNVVVRGLYYYTGKAGLRVGMRVFLQPDPTNHYDSNAVAVNRRDGTLIGHINRSDAALLSPCLLGGMEVEATVHSINKGERKGESCVISLDIPEEFRKTLTRQPVIHKPSGHDPPKQSYTSSYSTGYPHTKLRQPSVRLPESSVTPPVQTPPPTITPTQQSSCFVATVVFESPNHPTVEWLRWWRDNRLIQHVLGRAFVSVYQHTGPLFAKVVARWPAMRLILKKWLERFVTWKKEANASAR
jgi:hypothetical protein